MLFPEYAGEIEPEIVSVGSPPLILKFSGDRFMDIEEGIKGLSKLEETCAGDDSSQFSREII
jgi:hypothetical protein